MTVKDKIIFLILALIIAGDLFLNNESEYLVGATSYNFGFAPTITGFAYLTNHGKLFKFQNKKPEQKYRSRSE